MNDKEIKQELLRLSQEIKTLQGKADALVIGRPVCILSDYNGQPYGRSRRSLRGETRTVDRVLIASYWGISLFLREEHVAIPMDEVKWL